MTKPRSKLRKLFFFPFVCLSLLAVDSSPTSAISGTRCPNVGARKVSKKATYVCRKQGKNLKWVKLNSSGGSSASTTSTTTTVPSTCRTSEEAYSRFPIAMVDSGWASVVKAIEPVLAAADPSGKTMVSLVTVNDPQTNNLVYGRYYMQRYPKAYPETDNGRCTMMGLILDLKVKFAGADRSDDSMKTGLKAATYAALKEVLTNWRTLDGELLQYVLIELVADECSGREVHGGCPWNDYGFMYFQPSTISVAKIVQIAANDVFDLADASSPRWPRPFSTPSKAPKSPFAVGSALDTVPDSNFGHESQTYVEFSKDTPELAQTINLTATITAESAWFMASSHISVLPDGRLTSEPSSEPLPVSARLRIWKYNGDGDIPNELSLGDFTNVAEVISGFNMPYNTLFKVTLSNPIQLSPGRYVVTLALLDWDKIKFPYVRLVAQAMGGSGETDSYPDGIAYRACDYREGSGSALASAPTVDRSREEAKSNNCKMFYPVIVKGENSARPKEHSWVWSDMSMKLSGS